MVQPARSHDERVFPRIWVRHLLYRLKAELWELNAQLTLPPVPGEPFVLRSSPKPLPRPRVPRTFQRALELGRDPAMAEFAEPISEHGRYNLSQRVAIHLPYSEEWLFLPLRPYFAARLPCVNYSTALVDACLQRLAMQRWSENAVKCARARYATRIGEVLTTGTKALMYQPEPIHLELLVALYHEQQWHRPNHPAADYARALCTVAAQAFARRPEFACVVDGSILSDAIETAFLRLCARIAIHGHRSARPTRDAVAWDDLEWELDALDNSLPAELFIPSQLFPLQQDADRTLAILESQIFPDPYPVPPTLYCKDVFPSANEAEAAFVDLLAAVPVSRERWKSYRRQAAYETQAH